MTNNNDLIKSAILNITRGIESSIEDDGFGKDVTYKTADKKELKELVQDIASDYFEELEMGEAMQENFSENVEIIISSEVENTPVCKDHFSPSMGHSSSLDRVDSDEFLTITLSVKDTDESLLFKSDFERILDDIIEHDPLSCTHRDKPEYEKDFQTVKVCLSNDIKKQNKSKNNKF